MNPRDPAQEAPDGAAPVGLLAVALAVIGAVLVEGVIVGAVALLGGPLAFMSVAVGCSAVSAVIAWAFDLEETRHGETLLVGRIRRWIGSRRDEATERMQRVARVAWWVGFLILSVTVGPFITTLVAKVRGADGVTGYFLAVASSFVFSAAWVAVYSGGIAAVRALL